MKKNDSRNESSNLTKSSDYLNNLNHKSFIKMTNQQSQAYPLSEYHPYKQNNNSIKVMISNDLLTKDKSNSILERNFFSLNSKIYDQQRSSFKDLNVLQNLDTNNNNYVKPVEVYQSNEK